MRALLLLGLLLPAPALAEDGCLLGCDQVIAGDEAREAAEALLGITLFSEAEVVGLVEGGFQDRFVQLRIDLPDSPKVDAVLGPLGTSSDALMPDGNAGFGPPGPKWWDVETRDLLRVGPASLPGFAAAMVGLAPASAGRLSLFVWAVQT